MVAIVHVTGWDHVKGSLPTFSITIPAATAGNKLIFLSGGGAICTPTGFTRLDSYGGGNQDVSTWEYTCIGGETVVAVTMNGTAGDNVSGVVVEAGPGLTFVGYSNNGGGSNPSTAGDHQFRPSSSVTASGQGTIFSIATVATTSAYSTANRLRQYGPRGKILREGGNQPGSDTQFIFQVGISDVDSTHSYPPSLAAGNYRTTTDWLLGDTCYITQVLFSDTSGIASAPSSGIPVVDENTLPGTDYNNYFLGTNATSADICGYTDKCSYAPGDTVNFKVYSNNSPARVEIYRRGFYGRETFGARNVLGNGDGYITVTPTVQSSPSVDSTTGATSCSWTTNATWTIPSDFPSGLCYIVFRRTDISSFSSGHFIVRASSVSGKAVVVLPDAGSHQPYNIWGSPSDHGDRSTGSWSGLDLYQGGADAALPNFAHRGYAVSFDRPYSTQSTQDVTYINDSCVGAIAFMEAQGYDLAYISDIDLEGSSHYLDSSSLVIMIGHHEYVSQDMYDAYRNAQANGVNVICTSSNTCLWRIHFDSTDTNKRTLICYKESGTLDISAGSIGSGYDPGDSNGSPRYSGTWRDYRTIMGAVNNTDIRRENSTFGQIFMASGPINQPAIVDAAYQTSTPAFRNSAAILALAPATTFTTSSNNAGYELDSRDGSAGEPSNIIDIFRHAYASTPNIANDVGSTYSGTATIEVGYTLWRNDTSQALTLCTGAWRSMWPCHRWQSSAPTGATIDLDWQNLFLCLFYDLGLHPHTLSSMRPGEDTDVSDPSIGAPGPDRSSIALAYGLTVPSQNVTVEPYAREESFGSLSISVGSVTIGATGVSSAEGLGSIALTTSVSILPPAIPSADSLGSPSCTGLYSLALQGIGSDSALGSQGMLLSNLIQLNSIDSAEQILSPLLIQYVTQISIDSAETLGNDNIFGVNTISPQGVSTSEILSSPGISTITFILPSSLSSYEFISNISVVSIFTVLLSYIPESYSLGTTQIIGLNTLAIESITSSEIISQNNLTSITNLLPIGMDSLENVNTGSIIPGQVIVITSSINTEEKTGSISVQIGVAEIIPTGIKSEEVIGNTTISTTITELVNSVLSDSSIASLLVSTLTNITPGSSDLSTGNIGSSSVSSSITSPVNNIGTSEVLGTPSVNTSITLAVYSVIEDYNLGNLTVLIGSITIAPYGIDSTEFIACPVLITGQVTVQSNSIITSETITTPSLSTGSIVINTIGINDSSLANSNLQALPGSVSIIAETNDSSNQFGTESISLTTTINLNSIASEEMTNTVYISRVVSLVGIQGSETVARVSVAVGTVNISPSGSQSKEDFGQSIIELAIAFVRIEVSDIQVLTTVYSPTTGWDAEALVLWEASI